MSDEPGRKAEASGELHEDRFVGDQDLTHWNTPGGQSLARRFQQASQTFGPHGALILTLLLGLQQRP